MSKITDDHLLRRAIVYVRQSTQDQVRHNHESQRRQYNLENKAQELGWKEVQVIDEDLGISASGFAPRKGFDYLLSEVCRGVVGAIFAIEASRLARNGREWHTLLEMCGLLETLIIDHDGVYDPRIVNDRLLLGMKGTISEMELTIFRQRSQEALKLKAQRGELFMTVAIGYLRNDNDGIEKDPDLRIQSSVDLVFQKFDEFSSVRQVLMWFRRNNASLPSVQYVDGNRTVIWRLPVYNTVMAILKNPIYAGAYAYGRTYTKTTVAHGQKRKVQGYRRAMEEWPVLIRDHHESYIDWNKYESILQIISENANMKGAMVRGPVRRGPALLAGVLRCGHCGRKLHVSYSGTKGRVLRYACRGGMVNHGGDKCISIGAVRLEKNISQEVLQVLSPLGVEAALQAARAMGEEDSELRDQKELGLVQARYEAERARKQYDLSDPENRLVTAELENRWNAKLHVVEKLQEELEALRVGKANLSEEDERHLLELGHDVEFAWNHKESNTELKKRIVRAVIKEIIISIENETVTAVIHWEGGDHTQVQFQKNRTGIHRWKIDMDTEELIRKLARIAVDHNIAIILNRLGRKTGRGNGWTAMRVVSFRSSKGIAVFQKTELRERGELLLADAAEHIGVRRMRLYGLIRKGTLSAHQACPGAPWVIKLDDLVRLAADMGIGTVKSGPCTNGQQLLIPDSIKT